MYLEEEERKKLGPKSYTYASSADVRGVSSLGVHPQILEDQLNLSQPGGADYAHHISTGTLGFSDLPTALWWDEFSVFKFGRGGLGIIQVLAAT